MKLYEKEILIPLKKGHSNLLGYFRDYVLNHIDEREIPIKFAVTKTEEKGYHCELGIMSGVRNISSYRRSKIFDFKKRHYENKNKFNTVLIVPTGIDAEIGGHAGDAGVVAILLANACDTLITHPNVVNASDINELPKNGFYVEGSILSRFLMGTIGLQKVRSNSLEVILEGHEDIFFTNAAINSVNAARATLGISCNEVVILRDMFRMKSEYSNSGRAVGIIENLEGLVDLLSLKRKNYDAVAISSVIEVDPNIHKSYYEGGIVNPWGGVEAMLTHSLSYLFDVPVAHAPMLESREIMGLDFGIVDPRMAAETVSTTFFHSVLKGLHKSPRIVSDNALGSQGVVDVSDISCLVISDKCIGLPTLAALEQNIPVIAVKGNENLMRNDLNQLPWKEGQFYKAENYHEAVGIIYCMKAGIDPRSVRRPLDFVKVNSY